MYKLWKRFFRNIYFNSVKKFIGFKKSQLAEQIVQHITTLGNLEWLSYIFYTPLYVSHISAKEKKEEIHARFSCSHQNSRWQERNQAKNSKGAQAYCRLIATPIGNMLPKTQKLSRVTFPKYNEPKKTWAGDCLRVQYSFTGSVPNARFAVVVPKKVHSLAVRRNSIKRAVYTAILGCASTVPSNKGMKIVIFPLKKDSVLSPACIIRDIQSFFSHIKWASLKDHFCGSFGSIKRFSLLIRDGFDLLYP